LGFLLTIFNVSSPQKIPLAWKRGALINLIMLSFIILTLLVFMVRLKINQPAVFKIFLASFGFIFAFLKKYSHDELNKPFHSDPGAETKLFPKTLGD